MYLTDFPLLPSVKDPAPKSPARALTDKELAARAEMRDIGFQVVARAHRSIRCAEDHRERYNEGGADGS